MRTVRTILALLALLSPGAAQTFVVAPTAGPGVDFTEIATAVAAVPDGATLLVRAGSYLAFTIDDKALTILCETGVLFSDLGSSPFTRPTYTIRNLAPQRQVLLRGCTFGSNEVQFAVENCSGPVVLEDVRVGFLFTPAPDMIRLRNCAQVWLHDCSLGGVRCIGSAVAAAGCTFDGGLAAASLGGSCTGNTVGLAVDGGSCTLTDCQLLGGVGCNNTGPFVFGFNRPGLLLANNADVRLLEPGLVRAGNNPIQPAVDAIAGVGSVRADPAVTLTGTVAATVGLSQSALPSVLGTSAATGGTLTAAARGPIGTFVILLVGLPGLPVAVPGLADPIWLQPTAFEFAAFGVPQPGAPVTVAVAVPASSGFVGVRLAWQAVAAPGAGPLVAGNPSTTIVR